MHPLAPLARAKVSSFVSADYSGTLRAALTERMFLTPVRIALPTAAITPLDRPLEAFSCFLQLLLQRSLHLFRKAGFGRRSVLWRPSAARISSSLRGFGPSGIFSIHFRMTSPYNTARMHSETTERTHAHTHTESLLDLMRMANPLCSPHPGTSWPPKHPPGNSRHHDARNEQSIVEMSQPSGAYAPETDVDAFWWRVRHRTTQATWGDDESSAMGRFDSFC